MTTISKLKLSGSTDGRGVKVAATSSSGTTIHPAHTSALDEVWLWAVNSDTAAKKLTVQFGGTSDPDDSIEVTAAAAGKGHRSQRRLALQVSSSFGTSRDVPPAEMEEGVSR